MLEYGRNGNGCRRGEIKEKKGGSKKKKAPARAKFDVAKAMLKSEKLYDDLLKEAAKVENDDIEPETITAEYIVVARIKPNDFKGMNISGAASVSDWVPVVELTLFESHSVDFNRRCYRVCS